MVNLKKKQISETGNFTLQNQWEGELYLKYKFYFPKWASKVMLTLVEIGLFLTGQ